MAKKKKRELQHMRQAPSRKRSYELGSTAPNEIYKPGFPMNLLGNVRLFAGIGVVVAVIMVVTALLTNTTNDDLGDPDSLPTATAVPSASASASPSASATTAAKQFSAAEQVIDPAAQTYTATIKTNKGDIVLQLFADVAPKTVNSFAFLAENGYFDDTTFHRVVSNFVIQGGDPTGTGGGGPGYLTDDEPSEIRNTTGTIAMAKTTGASQFGSQFFINLKDNPSLDYDAANAQSKFYPFGRVIEGMDVVTAIGQVQTGSGDRPVEPVTVSTVEITGTAK